MIDELTTSGACRRTRPYPPLVALVYSLSFGGFCIYWALPPAANDGIGLAVAVLSLCLLGISSGWSASQPGMFKPFGKSFKFSWKASLAWTMMACFAEYLVTDFTATATLLQFPSYVLLGFVCSILTFVVAYLVRTVGRLGLRNPQVLRDIGQVLGLILAIVALVLGLGSVPRAADKVEKAPNVLSSQVDRQASEEGPEGP